MSLMARLLLKLSDRLPLRVIRAAPEEGGHTYLERYFLCRLPGGGACYLHHFRASDPDRGPHDHPWNWAASLVLAGGYLEERLADFGTRRVTSHHRRPGTINRLRAGDFHRVILGTRAEAWTIFVHGPWVRSWGFIRPIDADPAEPGVWFDTFALPKAAEDEDTCWWRTAPTGAEIRAAGEDAL